MTPPVLQVTELWVRQGQASAFERGFAKIESLIRDAEGRLAHELRRSAEHEHHYVLLVEWRTPGDLTKRFQSSVAYARLLDTLLPWLERSPETGMFHAVPSLLDRPHTID